MPDEEKIDTANRFMVGMRGDGLLQVMSPPHQLQPITAEEAYGLAAWLVALAGDRERFLKVLDAVEAT